MSSAISLPVAVAKAVEADIPALAEINALSYLPEAICPFFFSGWPNPAPFISYCTSRAEKNFKDPSTEIYKVFDTQSSEILGFVCMSVSDGNKAHGGSANPENPPAGFNLEFGMYSAKKMATLGECVKGMKHFTLASFAVHPKHQRRGLGGHLLQHCANIADAAGLPTYLAAFPKAHPLYWKFGYQDVDHCDVDLNEWGTKYSGFGIYRLYGMLRQPAAVLKK